MAASGSDIRAGGAFYELSLRNAQFLGGLNAAQARVAAFGRAIIAVGAKIGGLGALATAAATKVHALGGAIGSAGMKLSTFGLLFGGALFGASKVFSEMGDQIAKVSTRLGITTEAASALVFAADQSGVSVEELEGGLRRMQRTLFEAINGSKEARDAFEDLGLSVEEMGRLTPDQQLLRLAEAFRQVEDAATSASNVASPNAPVVPAIPAPTVPAVTMPGIAPPVIPAATMPAIPAPTVPAADIGPLAGRAGEVVREIAAIQNPTERAARAMQILGRGGAALLPLFKDGAAGIRQLAIEAEKRGLIWTEAEAKAAEAFNDTLSATWMTLKRVVALIGGAVAPAISTLTNYLRDIAKPMGDWIRANSELFGLLTYATVGALGAGLAVATLGKAISIASNVLKLFRVVTFTVQAALTAVGLAFSATAMAIGAVRSAINLAIYAALLPFKLAMMAGKAVMTAFSVVTGLVSVAFAAVKTAMMGALTVALLPYTAALAVSKVVMIAFKAVATAVSVAMAFVSTATTAAATVFKGIFVAGLGIAAGAMIAFGALVIGVGASLIGSVVSFAINAVSGIAGAISNIGGAVVSGTQSIFSSVVSGAQAIGSRIAQATGTWFSGFGGDFFTAWDGIKAAMASGDLGSAMGIGGAFLEVTWERIVGFAMDIWDDFRDSFGRIWNTIRGTAVSVFNTIRSHLTNLGGQITSIVGSLHAGLAALGLANTPQANLNPTYTLNGEQVPDWLVNGPAGSGVGMWHQLNAEQADQNQMYSSLAALLGMNPSEMVMPASTLPQMTGTGVQLAPGLGNQVSAPVPVPGLATVSVDGQLNSSQIRAIADELPRDLVESLINNVEGIDNFLRGRIGRNAIGDEAAMLERALDRRQAVIERQERIADLQRSLENESLIAQMRQSLELQGLDEQGNRRQLPDSIEMQRNMQVTGTFSGEAARGLGAGSTDRVAIATETAVELQREMVNQLREANRRELGLRFA